MERAFPATASLVSVEEMACYPNVAGRHIVQYPQCLRYRHAMWLW
ncbi:hypothetical protein BIFGAL_03712 [Bifidobacterium gallicum DSM 20093 = LMG 11596]|uniref:Uncharacterized protein n=1 Tax=Bifidobacterium gallicum DSM 20093 = LMG 11596 TaxID=561180 RepID=D1NV31_9BIFI|nr:hypothetical protein BIFGAL_03712 [Bifidobacterium gallicum DSM 20093 = LMG 11596]